MRRQPQARQANLVPRDSPAPACRRHENSCEGIATASQPEKSTTRPDAQVARIAADQNGIVTTRQLNTNGIDHDAIAVRVRRGHLHPLFRGVYGVGHDALTQTAYFTAAVLACGARATFEPPRGRRPPRSARLG